MKATELRIGNWVRWNYEEGLEGNVYIVEHGYELDDISNNPNMVKPIPLTEEWLERFGFISDPYQDMYIKCWLKINCDKTRGKLELWVENINSKVVYLEFVHTLQNLYFALTGEELELNKCKKG